jgi:acyl-CoA reductase-like NAD-dependent aldehyde dehydrogenase
LNKQKVSLELGGNAAVIVDRTANIEDAVSKIITGAFSQAGQSCISVQRVFVHKEIYDTFLSKLIADTEKMKVGSPFEDDTDVASMISEEEARRAEGWVQDAIAEGAKVMTGGRREKAVLIPTILCKTNKNMNVNSREVFAPVATVTEFTEFRDAVEMVNDSMYGLQAGVFTNDMKNAFYAFDNIETGGVIINHVSTYRMDAMPYGGVKESGNAREGVRYAIEEMTERKIMVMF